MPVLGTQCGKGYSFHKILVLLPRSSQLGTVVKQDAGLDGFLSDLAVLVMVFAVIFRNGTSINRGNISHQT